MGWLERAGLERGDGVVQGERPVLAGRTPELQPARKARPEQPRLRALLWPRAGTHRIPLSLPSQAGEVFPVDAELVAGAERGERAGIDLL